MLVVTVSSEPMGILWSNEESLCEYVAIAKRQIKRCRIMPTRKKKVVRVPKSTAAADRLANALAKRTKAELIDVIVDIARADRSMMRQLQKQFDVQALPEELVAETQQAIVDATDFDERNINDNFDYDYQAYSTIERNFGRLINMGYLHEAMALSLELMKQGSYQVEMSDEGLMTDDIEACLKVVIGALKKSKLPPGDIIEWCVALSKKDRVGFICDKEIKDLQKQLKSS